MSVPEEIVFDNCLISFRMLQYLFSTLDTPCNEEDYHAEGFPDEHRARLQERVVEGLHLPHTVLGLQFVSPSEEVIHDE